MPDPVDNNDDNSDDDATGPPPPPGRRELTVALALLYGGTGLLLVLSLAIPYVVSLQQVALAAMLLTIPSFVLSRYAAPLTIDDLGVSLGPWKRTLGLSLATMAVVFTLFAVGNHFFRLYLTDARPMFDLSQLLRWGEDLEDRPRDVCAKRADGKVRVWFDQRAMWIVGPPDKRLGVEVKAAPEAVTQARAVRCRNPGPGSEATPLRAHAFAGRLGVFDVPKGFGIWLPLVDQTHVEATLSLDGQPVGDGAVLTGEHERAADAPLDVGLNLWWLLTYLVVHLGLVALPEEWFFRGYLMPRLDQRFGTPVTILGAKVGWGLVLSAAAFALLHPILIPGVHRLAVFFPALLFGWLRARSGNIGAAVVVHAGANVLQAILGRFYI